MVKIKKTKTRKPTEMLGVIAVGVFTSIVTWAFSGQTKPASHYGRMWVEILVRADGIEPTITFRALAVS